jgi:hypothetical protein
MNGGTFRLEARSGGGALPKVHSEASLWFCNNRVTAREASCIYNLGESHSSYRPTGSAAAVLSCCRADFTPFEVHFSTQQLFTYFRHARCSDARDRVYGLLGLVDDEELDTFPICADYFKTASPVCAKL